MRVQLLSRPSDGPPDENVGTEEADCEKQEGLLCASGINLSFQGRTGKVSPTAA
jgi:hypothetical protein